MAQWLRRPSRCRRHYQLSVLSLSLFFISMYLVMWQQRTKCLRKTAFISLWHNELQEARSSRWRPLGLTEGNVSWALPLMQQACGWAPGLFSSLSKQASGSAVAQGRSENGQQAFTHVYPVLATPRSSYCTAERDRMGLQGCPGV